MQIIIIVIRKHRQTRKSNKVATIPTENLRRPMRKHLNP